MGYHETYVRFIISMSTNAKNLVNIGPAVAEILGEICRLCLLIQKGAVVTLVISRITGPIIMKFAQYVGKYCHFIFLNWNGDCNPFWNATVLNERIYPNFVIKLVAMATSLEESGKEVQIEHLRTNTYHLVENGENRSSES